MSDDMIDPFLIAAIHPVVCCFATVSSSKSKAEERVLTVNTRHRIGGLRYGSSVG